MSLKLLTSLFFITVVSAPLLFMVQALIVWRESSQILVQRRYHEMQRSVIAGLEKIYRENYVPGIRQLSQNLSIQLKVVGKQLQSQQLYEWLDLNHCKKSYGLECIMTARIELARKQNFSYQQKIEKFCDDSFRKFPNPNFIFDDDDFKAINKMDPERKYLQCEPNHIADLIDKTIVESGVDKIPLNYKFRSWVENQHPMLIYLPELIQDDDNIDKIAPWSLISPIWIKPVIYYLWMGGSKGLGRQVQTKKIRLESPVFPQDSDWEMTDPRLAAGFNIYWKHNSASTIDEFESEPSAEPTYFDYILLSNKQMSMSYIDLVYSILEKRSPPLQAHPKYINLRASLATRIRSLFKLRVEGLSHEPSFINLMKMDREVWRSNHLDKVLIDSRVSLHKNDFNQSDDIYEGILLGNKIYYGVDDKLLFKESNLANVIIVFTILISLLILSAIILISFNILPRPIQDLISRIKSIELNAVLSQRLKFSKPLSGDEITTLTSSFQLMKSELTLRFRQMHFVRLINQQILTRQPLQQTIESVAQYIYECLPNEPQFLGVYFFNSARQSEPTFYHEYGSAFDISNITSLENQNLGKIIIDKVRYRWYRANLTDEASNQSCYFLLVFDENCLGSNDITSIESFINAIISQLQALLYQIVLWQIQKDNQIASQLQKGILAPITLKTDLFEISADMRSCGYLGGDFFNVISKDHSTLFGIADVTSKGIAPALVGSCAHSLIHYFSKESPNQILQKVNQNLIAEGFSEQHFVTCFLGEIDDNLELKYVAAGHQMMIHIGKDAKINYLNGPNIPLGLDPDQEFVIQTIQLEPGDLIFLYTDGIPELQDAQLEIFTQERLESFLLEHKNLKASEIEDKLYEEVSNFASKSGLSDDITTVIISIVDKN